MLFATIENMKISFKSKKAYEEFKKFLDKNDDITYKWNWNDVQIY